MKLNIFLIGLLIVSCNNVGLNNQKNIEKLKIGDSKSIVISKMGREPDKVLFFDTTFIMRKKMYNITTFMYRSPRFSSSDFFIDFDNNNKLVHITGTNYFY